VVVAVVFPVKVEFVIITPVVAPRVKSAPPWLAERLLRREEFSIVVVALETCIPPPALEVLRQP